jgi:hypothetical protein
LRVGAEIAIFNQFLDPEPTDERPH